MGFNIIIGTERKIVRNVLGLRKVKAEYKRPHTNKEIYSKIENIIYIEKKRRLFGNIAKMLNCC